ncbi:hypothetical protein JF66_13720 [Cryobacterium sp. MLB-32]|uniref:hypothetical protein n=1 Tax=Cryobacterium sp. MLB-32 TaxID=1529318 RepID=UPI0004E61EC5|nr:hypothetical protein [Cryobacterium sp. MLB-32]KFF59110.1 hypothetical protein JF66_13720 [Cryobacterium sp. MLB-32]
MRAQTRVPCSDRWLRLGESGPNLYERDAVFHGLNGLRGAAGETLGVETVLRARALQIGGAIACLVLVATLPIPSIVGGIIVLAVGIVYRFARLRLARC